MAFTGVAVVKQVTDRLVRISGLALAPGASGTIGLHGRTAAPGVRLPEQFIVGLYAYHGSDVTLQDSIECTSNDVLAGALALPVSVVKTGTTDLDFTITITNNALALTTAAQEIMVRFHD